MAMNERTRAMLTLVALTMLTAGCRGSESSRVGCDTAMRCVFGEAAETTAAGELWLIARAVRDTVGRGDPVEVFYAVRNEGPPRFLSNDPDLFVFEVIGPEGRALVPEYRSERPNLGAQAEVTLQPRGVIGQVVDLNCTSTRVVRAGVETCFLAFDFSDAGQYRILLTYHSQNALGVVGSSSRRLQSDTLRVFVR